MEKISKAAFRRLPRYHQILVAFEGIEKEYISSRELSEILEINETLVRKDMADLQIRGRQNQGYSIVVFRKRIEEFLGLEEVTEAVVVGAGHLGTAISTYQRFQNYGLKIVGLLDNDPEKIGREVEHCTINSLTKLTDIINEHKIKLVILTVPKQAAQEITDIAVAAGVRAIWNFSPQELHVPDGVRVRNEQLVAGFMALSYYLKNLTDEDDS